MGIILDLILLAIFILSLFMGYKKGLIGIIFNFCAFILSLVITIILFNPVSNFVISHTEIDDYLKNTIIKNGTLEVSSDSQSVNESTTVDKYVSKYIENTLKNSTNTAIESSAGIIAEKIVSIGVAILLFIFVRIILTSLKFLAEGLAELPIIKQFNKAGGTLYGILRGLLIIYIVLAIMFFITSLNNSVFLSELIDTSFISKLLYSHNIILDIIF